MNVWRIETVKDVRYRVQEALGFGRARSAFLVRLFFGDEILDDRMKIWTLDLVGNEKILTYAVEERWLEIRLTNVHGKEIAVNVGRRATVRDVRYKVQALLGLERTLDSSRSVRLMIGGEYLEDWTIYWTLDLLGNEKCVVYTVEDCYSHPPSLISSTSSDNASHETDSNCD